MLERLQEMANLSVARGVGFAGLAIICMMIGFAGDTFALLKAGGLGFFMVATVLLLKAQAAPRLAYRRTEVWLMLENHERPPDGQAQGLIAAARQGALYRFAYTTSCVSAAFLGFATFVRLTGIA